MDRNQLHVVFGSGQIGRRVATRLVAGGHRVRIVSRTPAALAGAETAGGDARDLAFAAEAARGAAVVYDCLNPLYQHWKRDLVALGRGPLEAAIATGARLVALDCLYMYGSPAGPMTEASPIQPVSRKGALRAELAALRLAAVARGAGHVAIARASDFFGPDLAASWWGDRFYQRVLAGKPGECLGDPDQPHSYTYAEDVARAIVMLGEADGDVDGVWHVPTEPAGTTRQLAERLGRALDRRVEMVTMSPLLLRALGLVAPFMRELPEMAYQWHAPFVIDDAKFRARFAMTPTPIADQIAATAAWARQRFVDHRAAA